MNKEIDLPIADVQSTHDTRRILPLTESASRQFVIPIVVADKDDGVQHTVALFNMYVNLPHKI